MNTILKIDSSLFGEHGVSTQLANNLIEQLKAQNPELSVIQRRFADQPVPHIDAAWIQALL